jgi:hypothetical protein
LGCEPESPGVDSLEGLGIGDPSPLSDSNRWGVAFSPAALEGPAIGDPSSLSTLGSGGGGTWIRGIFRFGEPLDFGSALTVALEESAVGEDTTFSFSDVGDHDIKSCSAVVAAVAFFSLFPFGIATSSEVCSGLSCLMELAGRTGNESIWQLVDGCFIFPFGVHSSPCVKTINQGEACEERREEGEGRGGEGRGGERKEFTQAARVLQLLERLNERRERNGGGVVFFLIPAEAALPFPCTVAILHSRRG